MEVVNFGDLRNRRQLERPALIEEAKQVIARKPEHVERELVVEWIGEVRDLLIRIETAMGITHGRKI